MPNLCTIREFVENPGSLLAILNDSRGYTIIPFVHYTVTSAVKNCFDIH